MPPKPLSSIRKNKERTDEDHDNHARNGACAIDLLRVCGGWRRRRWWRRRCRGRRRRGLGRCGRGRNSWHRHGCPKRRNIGHDQRHDRYGHRHHREHDRKHHPRNDQRAEQFDQRLCQQFAGHDVQQPRHWYKARLLVVAVARPELLGTSGLVLSAVIASLSWGCRARSCHATATHTHVEGTRRS